MLSKVTLSFTLLFWSYALEKFKSGKGINPKGTQGKVRVLIHFTKSSS